MGSVFHSIHREFALVLKKRFDLDVFVETGTFRRDATAWAAKNFSRVYTVDVFKNYVDGAIKTTCKGLENIEFFLGQSDKVLPEILGDIHQPALVFLDAHWGGDLHYEKPEVECPLLGELDAIAKNNHNHILMIDDARLFIPPIPEPLTPGKWPTIGEINSKLEKMGYFIIIIDDTIIGVPRGTFGFK